MARIDFKNCMWPTNLPLKDFELTQQAPGTYELGELVILKDEAGRLLDYRDNEKTFRIRKILTKANGVNAAHRIEYEGDRISAFLYALFTNSIRQYTRIKTEGFLHRNYGTIPEYGLPRRELLIENQEVSALTFDFRHTKPMPRAMVTGSSKITIAVIKHFSDQNKAILIGRDDSFIVQKCYQEELADTMDFFCGKYVKMEVFGLKQISTCSLQLIH